MRLISASNQEALEARTLVARDFLSIFPRRRDNGVIVHDGMWSDIRDVEIDVISPDTGAPVTREFHGAGTLISTDDIPMVSNLTVQNVGIRMSQVHERVEQLVRFYDVKFARVEIFRGLLDPGSREIVAPAECRFVGFVDKAEIRTPSENEYGAVILSCVSHTQEMTRSNPDTRSHESQIRRSATDDFFRDAGVVGEWELSWGKTTGNPSERQQQAGSVWR